MIYYLVEGEPEHILDFIYFMEPEKVKEWAVEHGLIVVML